MCKQDYKPHRDVMSIAFDLYSTLLYLEGNESQSLSWQGDPTNPDFMCFSRFWRLSGSLKLAPDVMNCQKDIRNCGNTKMENVYKTYEGNHASLYWRNLIPEDVIIIFS